MNKLEYTKELIRCWVEAWGVDGVHYALSGGKDSMVLRDIVRSLYPQIPGVFSNTGLEYPEIVSLVKSLDNVVIVRPKKPFHKVIRDHGWPVISKQVARGVYDCQNASPRNQKTVSLRLTGINSKGQSCKSMMLAHKWRFLIDAPFKISNFCCDHLKKEPMKRYQKKTGRRPMIGLMKEESAYRRKFLEDGGCNMYHLNEPASYPLANWTTKDIWEYTHTHNIPYASVYDKGEKRTGCVFCMFGIMYDRDRFVRLKRNSPRQWDYVINTLGAGEVLDFIGIPYEEEDTHRCLR